jgi:hypothetical protein
MNFYKFFLVLVLLTFTSCLNGVKSASKVLRGANEASKISRGVEYTVLTTEKIAKRKLLRDKVIAAKRLHTAKKVKESSDKRESKK